MQESRTSIKLERGKQNLAEIVSTTQRGARNRKLEIESRRATVEVINYNWGYGCKCEALLPENFVPPPDEFFPELSLDIDLRDDDKRPAPKNTGSKQDTFIERLDETIMDFLDDIAEHCTQLDHTNPGLIEQVLANQTVLE